jgi:Baseplate J-like protein
MEPRQPKYAREVRELLGNLEHDGQDKEDSEPEPQIPNTPRIQREVHFIFVREEDEPEVVDSIAQVADLDTEPLRPKQQPTPLAGTGILPFILFVTLLCLFSIASQVYQIVNPFSVTVTLQARSQQLQLTGSLQLGRLLNPVTVSQSATANTTGKGHQDAKAATGFITFYNGQLQSITVPAGTMLTGTDGVQVTTDADATIPPESGSIPPTFGQTTLPAHAITPGSNGNIPPGDINQGCCNGVKAVNLNAFSGGQNERAYLFVTKADIQTAAIPLQATVAQSINGAIQGQITAQEGFVTPSCTTTTASDHQPGDEASTVKVTVSETCSALAFNQDTLQEKVTQLLTTQAVKKLGAGYGLLNTPQITVTQAIPGKQITLAFKSVSTWAFGISSQQQRRMKKLLAGKTTQQALQLLQSLPGIESASVAFSGFGDSSSIPKALANIHVTMFVAA